MMNVSTIQQKIVAVLHDVLEDTNTTVDELYELGCDNDIVEAILALTKLKGESRTEAAKRTLQNPIARVVKIADINDNMDLSRIHSPTDKDFERIKEYQLVRDILTQSI
jgi:(p)ppGpp synthase/HD superfamily hydrolase